VLYIYAQRCLHHPASSGIRVRLGAQQSVGTSQSQTGALEQDRCRTGVAPAAGPLPKHSWKVCSSLFLTGCSHRVHGFSPGSHLVLTKFAPGLHRLQSVMGSMYLLTPPWHLHLTLPVRIHAGYTLDTLRKHVHAAHSHPETMSASIA
jgi:hypothetical protein